jgi:hypothetical protein
MMTRPRSDAELDFTAALARQTPEQRNDGRAAWIEFNASGIDSSSARRFEGEHGVEELGLLLRKYLDPLQNDDLMNGKECRGVIILEDLGSEWVSLLSSILGIPVSVFACHWALPEDHTLGRVRIPLGQDARYHFILNYVQDHAIRIPRKNKGRIRVPTENMSSTDLTRLYLPHQLPCQ